MKAIFILLLPAFLGPWLALGQFPPNAPRPVALNCAVTSSGSPCSIPFIYNAKTYGGCITQDNNGAAWCPTSLSSTGFAQNYSNCNSRCPNSDPIEPASCKTVNGFDCAPVFRFNDVIYNNTCTMAGNSSAWCAITVFNETLEAKKFEECNSKCPVSHCTVTSSESPCSIPFIYNDKTYGACITQDNNGAAWCPTSLSSTGFAQNYSNCDSRCLNSNPIEPESCKTVNGFDCAPEFNYNGVVYNNTCTMAGDNRAWCAIAVFNETLETKRFGYCNSKCPVAPPRPSASDCVTTAGQKCVFPFYYNGGTFNNCTKIDHGDTLWCGTMSNSGAWGNCNATTCGFL